MAYVCRSCSELKATGALPLLRAAAESGAVNAGAGCPDAPAVCAGAGGATSALEGPVKDRAVFRRFEGGVDATSSRRGAGVVAAYGG